MFLNSLNHFRAIAIIIIVAGHCFYTVDASFNTLPEITFGNLIAGGTVLFVFISGFLFHHIFYQRYRFNKFMSGKLKKVLLPYTLLSIVPIILLILQRDAYYDLYDPVGTGLLNVYIVPAIKYYFTGRFLTAYWYIPFVMVIFLMSPLHMAFIRLRFNLQLLITGLLFVVSLFLHRPEHDILILQSVVYFTPVYLLGIICSEKKEIVYAKLKNKEIFLLLLAVGLAALQAALGRFGSYQKPPLVYGGIDVMLFQKVTLCFFFMVWLHRFEHVSSKYINIVASTSFAIYFTHAYLLWLLGEIRWFASMSIQNPWLWYPFVTAGMVLACMLLAIGLKRLLPSHSRYIIGY
ncbi:MAG: acyltransferase, partial [Cyanobacteria bacterium J06632_3]